MNARQWYEEARRRLGDVLPELAPDDQGPPEARGPQSVQATVGEILQQKPGAALDVSDDVLPPRAPLTERQARSRARVESLLGRPLD